MINSKQDYSSYLQIRKQHDNKRKNSYEGSARQDPRVFENVVVEQLTQDVFDAYLRRISEDKRPEIKNGTEI